MKTLTTSYTELSQSFTEFSDIAKPCNSVLNSRDDFNNLFKMKMKQLNQTDRLESHGKSALRVFTLLILMILSGLDHLQHR